MPLNLKLLKNKNSNCHVLCRALYDIDVSAYPQTNESDPEKLCFLLSANYNVHTQISCCFEIFSGRRMLSGW